MAIADACLKKDLHADIAVVFSNNPSAPGIAKAKARGLPVETLPHFSPRRTYDQRVLDQLSDYAIDWVVLCGYMRILSPVFLSRFPRRVLNIHPSKLPKYPGTDAISRAFEAGESEIGVSIHYVDQGVDTGEIIIQEVVQVLPKDTLETLTQRVHILEHQLYPKAIQKVIYDNLQKKGS